MRQATNGRRRLVPVTAKPLPIGAGLRGCTQRDLDRVRVRSRRARGTVIGSGTGGVGGAARRGHAVLAATTGGAAFEVRDCASRPAVAAASEGGAGAIAVASDVVRTRGDTAQGTRPCWPSHRYLGPDGYRSSDPSPPVSHAFRMTTRTRGSPHPRTLHLPRRRPRRRPRVLRPQSRGRQNQTRSRPRPQAPDQRRDLPPATPRPGDHGPGRANGDVSAIQRDRSHTPTTSSSEKPLPATTKRARAQPPRGRDLDNKEEIDLHSSGTHRTGTQISRLRYCDDAPDRHLGVRACRGQPTLSLDWLGVGAAVSCSFGGQELVDQRAAQPLGVVSAIPAPYGVQ